MYQPDFVAYEDTFELLAWKDSNNLTVKCKLCHKAYCAGKTSASNFKHLADTSEDDQEETLHCHIRQKPSSSSKTAQRQLVASSLICLTFMTAEIVGGYISNSLAIMSDAAHMCTDLVSFLMSIFAVWIAQKSPTKRMPFGFYRAEILGALASILFVWILTGILVYSAIRRIQYSDYEIDADVMLIVSGSSVAMNIVMGLVLNGCCPIGGAQRHHHHSHGLSSRVGHTEPSNINIKAALIHVLGDLLQSIGVLISAYIIKYKPQYKIADPICTFIFSALVMCTTIPIMRDAVIILMEGFPRDMNYVSLKSALQSIKGVRMAHSLHVWSLTLQKNALAVHLAVDEDADPNVVLAAAQSLLRSKFGIFTSTVQVEKYVPSDMLSCDLCRGPS
ncbi:proton-coupled zinc antiporter SLC30A2-like isoform X2 [Ornithodoros turicata]|uniref:proton-coupled zinc antiporter SLC30A2-like isoform X2 n=1 Tax=Ornithodoros turicata TaxID=34597 RepID=UPI0031394E4E